MAFLNLVRKNDEDDRRDRSGGPSFDPPVYRQRYEFVEKIVREYGGKKVYSRINSLIKSEQTFMWFNTNSNNKSCCISCIIKYK